MPAYLSTIPGAVAGHDQSIAQSDDRSPAPIVILLLLVMGLAIMVGVLFRSVTDGIGNALNDMLATGKTLTRIKPPAIVPMPSEPNDTFRILLNEDEHDTDDAFVIVSADVHTVGDPRCFTCGRPKDKGDHSRCEM